MFLRILKKDIQKKKVMNLIVLLFVILASMFVGSGLNNVLTVLNGTDYYLEKGGVGDYVIITMGPNSIGALDDMLSSTPAIDAYRMDNVVYGSKDSLKKGDGSAIESKNVLLMQCLEDSTFHFFNEDNNAPAALAPGHCYVTGDFMAKNGLSEGDILEVGQEDVSVRLIVDGRLKDALLGSTFMGNTRILMHKDDFTKFSGSEKIAKAYSGQICCIDTKDVDTVDKAASGCKNISLAKPASTISMCYIMDMIVAFIVLLLSVCLIILSFVVLKVSLSFTINKEYREIGVMKAIGIKNRKIRTLFLTKYFGIAVVGSVIGFIASIPFTKLLLSSVSKNMVLGNSLGYLLNAIGAVIVVIVILLLAYLSTSKVKKATPVDAIRTGQSGERYSKKSKLHLSRSNKLGAPSFLAINDTASSPKRYISIVIAFALCTLFVLMLVNTTNTMRSEALISTFGTKSDLYMTSVKDSMEIMGSTEEETKAFFEKWEKEIADLGMPGHVALECQYGYNITYNGETTRVICEHGYGTNFEDYVFLEGSRPQCKNEVAITKILSKKLDIKIGDTITIDFGSEKIDCIVTAYYQSFNQIGEVIRLHPDAPVENTYITSTMSFQFTFDDHPDRKTILERQKILKDHFKNDEVFTTSEYVADCIQVVPTMETVQYLLLVITIIVVILVTILMELSFIADEKSQIALLKAIGFKNGRIYLWHVIRFGIVALFAVLLAGLLSIPMTNLCISPIFGMMGAYEIDYAIKPLEIFVIYPGIILLATLLVASLICLTSRSIHASDTANIE
ncbi:MAG: ABC transporter permease [Clostridiales bacterium]|nr:ABC transporter permease [Clostridiales bacterium]